MDAASEVVGFRLHLPSRIVWHNSRDLETNEPRGVARGNILAWEQHLADRLDGAPLDIKVEMDSQSILHRTLWLFGGAFTAAVAVLAFLIWFTMRKGAGEAATTASLEIGRPLFPFADLHPRGLRLQLLQERRVEPLTRLDIVHHSGEVVAGWNLRRACTCRRRRRAP